MQSITTSISIPPMIMGQFDPNLLSAPTWVMRDTSGSLDSRYKYIKERADKKIKGEQKKKKYQALEEEYLKLYEQATTKEKELKEKKNHKTQVPFYFIGSIDSKNEEIYRRIKQR